MKILGALVLVSALGLMTSAALAQYRFDGAKPRSQPGTSSNSGRGGGNAGVQRGGGDRGATGIGNSRVNSAISGQGRARGSRRGR